MIFAGECYAIFAFEEVFILMGVVPATCLRVDPAEVRRRYGLPASSLPAAA